MARDYPARADQVTGCPPHHWIIDTRTQTCKKCGEERPLPTPEPGQWGRVTSRPAAGAAEPAATPAPKAEAEDVEG